MEPWKKGWLYSESKYGRHQISHLLCYVTHATGHFLIRCLWLGVIQQHPTNRTDRLSSVERTVGSPALFFQQPLLQSVESWICVEDLHSLWSLALATTSLVVWSGQPTLRIDAKKVWRKTCHGATKVILIERITAWFLYLLHTVTRSVIFRSGYCHTYNLDEDSVMILCQQSVPRIGVTWCLTFHCAHFRWTRFNRECINASTHQHLYLLSSVHLLSMKTSGCTATPWKCTHVVL